MRRLAATLLVALACTPDHCPGPETFWERQGDAPTARLEVASAVVDGKVYVAGGLVPEGATRRVEVLDVRDGGPWHRAPDLPIALHHAMGVGYRGRFVVIGGIREDRRKSARVFELRGERWRELPRLRHARAAGGAVVIGDEIVLTGGADNERLVPETERFDGERWREGAPLPTPRDHLGAATDGRYMYVVGGRERSLERNLAALERYDPVTDEWTALPAAPTARGGIGVAFDQDMLVVLGGEGPAADAGPFGVFRAVEAFDPATERWSSLPEMEVPRHGVGVSVPGRILVVAGGARAGADYTAAVEALGIDVPCE